MSDSGFSKGRYGHRPIHAHLQEEGLDCGRDRAVRLARELGIQGEQGTRYKPLGTESAYNHGYSPNLLKANGKPESLDEVWVADTTYLLRWRGAGCTWRRLWTYSVGES